MIGEFDPLQKFLTRNQQHSMSRAINQRTGGKLGTERKGTGMGKWRQIQKTQDFLLGLNHRIKNTKREDIQGKDPPSLNTPLLSFLLSFF